MKQYAESPPEEVWAGITGILDREKRRNSLAWISRIAAAAAILFAAGSIWVLVQRMPERGMADREMPAGVGEDKSAPGARTGADQETGLTDKDRQDVTGRDEVNRTEPDLAEVSGQTPDETGRDRDAHPETGTEKFRAEESGPQQVMVASMLKEGDMVAGPAGEPALTSEDPGRVIPVLSDAAAGDESRLDYSLPMDTHGQDFVLAENRTTGTGDPGTGPLEVERGPQGGIDVFEEFGDGAQKPFRRWAVGGQMTPLYSYRDLGGSTMESSAYLAGAQPASAQSQASLDEIENGIVSYAAGINLNYAPLRKLSLQTGLYYSKMGLSVQNSYIASAGDQAWRVELPQLNVAIANSSGDIQLGGEKANAVLSNSIPSAAAFSDAHELSENSAEPDIRQGDLLQHFDYLEVPLILRYRLLDRRFGINLLGGLSTNILVGNDVYFQSGSSREYIGTTEGIRPVNYSSVLGFGLQYSILQNLNFNVEPTFRYYLNSINTGSGLSSHPYSLGFFTGVSYSF